MNDQDVQRWSRALDELEARVNQHRDVFVGANAVESYQLPTSLGPFPRELLGRARALLDELQQLEAELVGQMVVLRSRLGRRPESAPIPLYLDRRA